MSRPWIILLVLTGIAAVAFNLIHQAHLRNAGVPEIEGLREEVADLEGRLERQKKENQRLLLELKEAREELATAQANAAPPEPPEPTPAPTPENLSERVQQLRKLTFKQPVEFVRTPFDDIAQRTSQRILEGISEDEGKRRERAYFAMGFIADKFDYRWALAGLRNEQNGWFYDDREKKLFLNEEANLELPEARSRFVRSAMDALLQQNYQLGDPSLGDSHNDDKAMAAYCVLGGDSQLVQLHFSLSDMLGSQGGGSAGTPPPFYEAPIFMRERQNFPYDGGMTFHETARQHPQSGEDGFLDRIYARLPVSTAEILHPEELYFVVEPFEPVDYKWDDMTVAGADPVRSNVAGELNVMLLMKIVMAADLASEAAAGWRGDRYVIYPGSEGSDDHVFWRTTWATKEDAWEFANGVQKSLLFRYTIPFQKRYRTDEGFMVDDPTRTLRIRTSEDGLTVQVVNASAEEFADALEEKLGLP